MASILPPVKKAKRELVSVKDVKLVLNDVRECQLEIEKLNDKASEEILVVEEKFNAMRKTYFRQRNEHFRKLPKFWGTVLCRHPLVASIIQEEEKDCLNYINDCVAEDLDNIRLGFVISFYFDENPYLENKVITKTAHASAKSESTPVQWKEGQDLVAKCGKEKEIKIKKGPRPPASFFTWFAENNEAFSDIVAETIKEDLWPSALQYFLGTLPNEKSRMDYEYEYETDSSESEDYEDDEDEQEFDEEPQVLPDDEDSMEAEEVEGRLTPRSCVSSEEDEEGHVKSDEEGDGEEGKLEGDRKKNEPEENEEEGKT